MFYKKTGFWIVIILICIAGFLYIRQRSAPVEVKGVTVKKQDIEVTVTATSTGIVKSDVEVNITSQRTGKIAKMHIEEGDRIKSGNVVAELDTSEVLANLRKAQADIKKAEVDRINAKSEFKRKEALFKDELVTQQQYDDSQKILSIAEAQYEMARALLDVAQLQYDYSFIKSPVNGVVSQRNMDIGDTASPGPVIASIVDPEKLYINAPIDEADVSGVRLGQKAKTTIDAYPGQYFYGRVIKISPIVIGARQEARTFEVRITVPEDNIILKPGMSADIEIITGEAKDTLVVPSQAVMERGADRFVYIFRDGKAEKKNITTGIANWNFTEIREGLHEGDRVIITHDKPGFKEGVKVKFADSP